MVKNPAASVEDVRDTGLILETGRSLGGGNAYSLQYSRQENPIDRGVWHRL